MKYNSAKLIEAIKRNTQIPTSQRRFENSDFLAFLNEELNLKITGILLALRQDYYVTTIDIPLVASQSAYDIPGSAVGWKLESIGYLDSDSKYSSIPMISRSQRGKYDGIQNANSPSAVYIMGNILYTVPDMGADVTGSLSLDLVRIQNELVLPTSCGEISIVTDTGTDYQMTVDTVPIADGDTCDVISGTNPFNIIARGVTAGVAGNVITVTYGDDFERAPVAEDYVCIQGQTPYPNIPEDFHPVLAQAAAARCMAAASDVKGLQAQSLSLNDMIKTMKTRASKRIADSPRKIVGNDYILNLMRGR